MFFRKKIITRFAPSPTGFLHVGGLRTALYNYIYAKKNKGKFLLRIEDTDQARKVEGAAENLQKMLQIFGLTPDNAQPIIQSQRLELYSQAAEKLIKEGKAYYCFCTKDRLEQLRQDQEKNKQAPRYDGRCKHLSTEEVSKKIEAGDQHVIRFIIPESGQTKFTDLVRGEVSFDNQLIDDQVIIKSDGFPTYHLASVVDDNDMKVTHVIRGEEWLSSTPKHILLYQSLGLKPPQYSHLPLLLNPDKSKLSKRQGDVATEDFLTQGYLPEALLNFILLLGWNPGTEQEIFSMKEMIKEFDLNKVNKAGAIFNTEKLDWLNGQYIRKMSAEHLTKMAIPGFIKARLLTPEFSTGEANDDLTGYLGKTIVENFKVTISSQPIGFNQITKIVKIHQDKIKKISDLNEEIKYIFELDSYLPEILIWKKSSTEQTISNLNKLLTTLKEIKEPNWNELELEATVKNFIATNNYGNGDILFPMRAALTGKKASPGPFEVSSLLGKKESLARIEKAIYLLEK